VLVPLRLVQIVIVTVSLTVNVILDTRKTVLLHQTVTATVGRATVTAGVTVTALMTATVTVVQTPNATATVRRTGTATVRK
jgi:hypothetical protein